MLRRARPSNADVIVAAGFVFAASVEAVVTQAANTGLLVGGLIGAGILAILAVRRTMPVLPICVIVGAAILSTTIRGLLWPDAPADDAGVWIFALMLAAYSIGAHARGWTAALGVVLPLLLALTIDAATTSGWALVDGVVFVTVVAGLLPTTVGWIVRAGRDVATVLDEQRELALSEAQAQAASRMLADRLTMTERLRSGVLEGLRTIAGEAETEEDPALLEQRARVLLSRTRDEVVALTSGMDPPSPTQSDHPRDRRVLPRPGEWVLLAVVTAAWVAIIAVSQLVTPLDGTLGGSLFALLSACVIGALCGRWVAIAGLAVCLAGQFVGVGTNDPVGEGGLIFACWLGGVAVGRARQLVEERRVSARLRVEQGVAEHRRAIITERLRLARDVHDQLGHTLTVIVLQAGAARRIAAGNPQRTEILAAIAAAARAGLAAIESQPRTDLDGLLARTRDAGLEVTADVAVLDAEAGLDPGTREVACRIVQESLTNVLRHAPGAPARVSVHRAGSAVVVDVSNSPPTRPGDPAGTGRGLNGLRDRVLAQGGELGWGPQDGGFHVHAVLPAPPRADV